LKVTQGWFAAVSARRKHFKGWRDECLMEMSARLPRPINFDQSVSRRRLRARQNSARDLRTPQIQVLILVNCDAKNALENRRTRGT
jgi:hypothetical protein